MAQVDKVEVLEVNYPTKEGHVFSLAVVEKIINQINFGYKQGQPILVVSEHDGTTGVDTEKVTGTIVSAELVNDKLVLGFQRVVMANSGFNLPPSAYSWSIAGFCWWADHLIEMPHVIGYTGPKLYRVRDGFTVACVVRKPVRIKISTYMDMWTS